MAINMSLPNCAGIGLKPEFYDEALERSGADIWYEVHPENYMVDGGPRLYWLEQFASKFNMSFHGVGASLGGLDPYNKKHLNALKSLITRFNPAQVSEHATWSSYDGQFFADLLPLPRTREVQDHMVARIDEFQNAIGRQILIENPTNYMRAKTELDEPEFLVEIARRAGCGLLMDVNNIFLSSVNTGIDAKGYISAIPKALVGEIHIAGYNEDPVHGAALLIDTHSEDVSENVWSLLEFAIAHLGPKPVLLERDGNIPPFADLAREHTRANKILGHKQMAANPKQMVSL